MLYELLCYSLTMYASFCLCSFITRNFQYTPSRRFLYTCILPHYYIQTQLHAVSITHTFSIPIQTRDATSP